jgi:hypothetical protein
VDSAKQNLGLKYWARTVAELAGSMLRDQQFVRGRFPQHLDPH